MAAACLEVIELYEKNTLYHIQKKFVDFKCLVLRYLFVRTLATKETIDKKPLNSRTLRFGRTRWIEDVYLINIKGLKYNRITFIERKSRQFMIEKDSTCPIKRVLSCHRIQLDNAHCRS